jgi:hypothetical protein
VAIVAAIAIMAFTLQAQTAQKTWKDSAEYDMYSAASAAADPNQKLAALNAWKQKYPESDYRQERLVLYLKAYEQLKDVHRMLDTLDALHAQTPADVEVMRAIMLLVLSPQYQDRGATALARAEKVSGAVLASLDRKPDKNLEALTRTVLGWTAMHRKENEKAEQEFTKVLQLDPTSAQISVWMANVLRAQKTPEKISQALFHYARSAAYEGPGSFPPATRQQMDDYLTKSYNAYHGPDEAGLKELKTLASAQALPPDGFLIKTAQQIASEKDEDFKKNNPQLALWMSLKRELTGSGGQQYFDASMKGAEVPGGADGVQFFRGTVISARGKELVVGISDAKTPEVNLKLDGPIATRAASGAEIEFSGVPESFTADPFMVTFSVERAKVKGLKAPAAPSRRVRQ